MQTQITAAHIKHMLFLKQQLQNLNAIIDNKKICYLDIPVYGNFGDLLIFKGTLNFLKENDYEVTHCLSVFNFYDAAVTDDVTILLQGGGNIGDLYPLHQQFREHIISKFPNHRIVILPQTIHFGSHEQFDKSSAIFSKHQNLHICVRDTVSYEQAGKFSNKVYLFPDMAHQLYPINISVKKALDKIFYFRRQDVEFKNDIDSTLLARMDEIGDWADLIGSQHQSIINSMNRMQRIFSALMLNKFTADFTSKIWIIYVDFLYGRITKKLAKFKGIYSNRLHGYILANLMSIDSYLIDNSYSKNKHYYDTWMHIQESRGTNDRIKYKCISGEFKARY